MGNMSISLAIKEWALPDWSTEAKLQEELELQNYTIIAHLLKHVYVYHGRSQECHCGWLGAGNAGLPSSLLPSVL